MGSMQKQKGARGERDFAKFLRDEWRISARRGQQFSGGSESPDVITDLIGLHFEVKFTQRLNLEKAMAQAVNDSGQKIAIVASRKNNGEWLISLKAKDCLAFSALLRGIR